MSEQTSTLPKQLSKMNQKIDLTIGNPMYMQSYWDIVHQYHSGSLGISKINCSEFLSYDYANVYEKLKNAIKQIHESIGNAETSGYEIVVGNGASQLVSAASFASTSNGACGTYVRKPCWARLPKLLKYGAFVATMEPSLPINGRLAELVVLPNNPDNTIEEGTIGSEFIHDLCYYWPQYVKKENFKKRSDDVMIFGLSKATGHAGSRIGWALVKDKEFAKKMRKYIELTTSGVSKEAQHRAYIILDSVSKLDKSQFGSCFSFAEQKLNERWTALTRALAKHKDKFSLKNTSGMFALVKMPDGFDAHETLLGLFGVMSVPGSAMGVDQSYARISLGCSDYTFELLIKALGASNVA